MTDEQIFELAEKCGFQDDFGRWNFDNESLLDFVFLVQKSLAEPANSTTDFVEPVAWIEKDEDYLAVSADPFENAIPVYTAPPKREWVGLTVNEARKFYEKYTNRAELIYVIDKFLEEKNG